MLVDLQATENTYEHKIGVYDTFIKDSIPINKNDTTHHSTGMNRTVKTNDKPNI